MPLAFHLHRTLWRNVVMGCFVTTKTCTRQDSNLRPLLSGQNVASHHRYCLIVQELWRGLPLQGVPKIFTLLKWPWNAYRFSQSGVLLLPWAKKNIKNVPAFSWSENLALYSLLVAVIHHAIVIVHSRNFFGIGIYHFHIKSDSFQISLNPPPPLQYVGYPKGSD